MAKKIIMCKGLPGSGKSTWAKQEVTRWKNVKRVCKDDLREMLDCSQWSKENEAFVLKARDLLVHAALEADMEVIIDDTNLDPKHEKSLEDIAFGHGARFQIKSFTDVPLEECVRRDAQRSDRVGMKVIQDMYDRYLNPKDTDRSKHTAIICDLDGTVALLNGRSPYDASACESDILNMNVARIVKDLQNMGYHLLFCSGREEKYRGQTELWLQKHDFTYDGLFMRKTGDTRKDCIVKREILERDIVPRYFVHSVFDDRNQVVQMWRDAGLTCFQVAPGDF